MLFRDFQPAAGPISIAKTFADGHELRVNSANVWISCGVEVE
jgi:hypothetical protein